MKKYYHEFLMSTEKIHGYACVSKLWIPLDGCWSDMLWVSYQNGIRDGQYLGIIEWEDGTK